MLQNAIDDAKRSARAAMRGWGLGAAAATCAAIALGFLCAAAFIFIRDRYDPLTACLAEFGGFAFVSIVLIAWRQAARRRARRSVKVAKSAALASLTDPMVIAAGLQLVRAVGVKRLVPLIAVGGIALGLLAKSKSDPRSES